MHFYFQTNEVLWVLHLAVCMNKHDDVSDPHHLARRQPKLKSE